MRACAGASLRPERRTTTRTGRSSSCRAFRPAATPTPSRACSVRSLAKVAGPAGDFGGPRRRGRQYRGRTGRPRRRRTATRCCSRPPRMWCRPRSIKTLNYDPVNDFAFISSMTNVPFFIVTYADSPYKTIKDLIDAATRQTRRREHRHRGHRHRTAHVPGAVRVDARRRKSQHVPFRGDAGAVTGLLSQERRRHRRAGECGSRQRSGRQLSRARDHRKGTLACIEGRADRCGNRIARFRDDRLDRRRHHPRRAKADYRAAQR